METNQSSAFFGYDMSKNFTYLPFQQLSTQQGIE